MALTISIRVGKLAWVGRHIRPTKQTRGKPPLVDCILLINASCLRLNTRSSKFMIHRDASTSTLVTVSDTTVRIQKRNAWALCFARMVMQGPTLHGLTQQREIRSNARKCKPCLAGSHAMCRHIDFVHSLL